MEPIRNYNTPNETRGSFSSASVLNLNRGVSQKKDSGQIRSIPYRANGSHLSQSAVDSSEVGRKSSTPGALIFEQLQSGVQGAKKAALNDRKNGVGIADGLSSFKKEKDAQTFFKLVGQTLAVNAGSIRKGSASGPAAAPNYAPGLMQQQSQGLTEPWTTVIDSFGQQAQTVLQHQSQQLALDYIGSETGLNLSNMSLSEAADTVFSWLSGEGTAANTATGAATPGGVIAGGVTSGTVPSAASGAPSWGSAVIGALGAAYSAFQLIDNWGQNTPQQGAVSGATIGAYLGTQICPGMGTAIGAGLGAIAGAVIGFFHGGKHKDQVARDQMRSQLMQVGLIDQDSGITLADGTTYNIGIDGGHRYPNVDGTDRRAYDVDFSDPLAAQVVGWAQPLAELLYPGNKKLKDDLTGYLVNAALSNAPTLETARQNILRFYDQLELTPEKVVQGLRILDQQGALGAELPAYLSGIASVLSGTGQLDSSEQLRY